MSEVSWLLISAVIAFMIFLAAKHVEIDKRIVEIRERAMFTERDFFLFSNVSFYFALANIFLFLAFSESVFSTIHEKAVVMFALFICSAAGYLCRREKEKEIMRKVIEPQRADKEAIRLLKYRFFFSMMVGSLIFSLIDLYNILK